MFINIHTYIHTYIHVHRSKTPPPTPKYMQNTHVSKMKRASLYENVKKVNKYIYVRMRL